MTQINTIIIGLEFSHTGGNTTEKTLQFKQSADVVQSVLDAIKLQIHTYAETLLFNNVIGFDSTYMLTGNGTLDPYDIVIDDCNAHGLKAIPKLKHLSYVDSNGISQVQQL